MSKSFRAIQISLDFIIPSDMNGYELAEKVRDISNRHLDCPVICVGADCCSDDMTDYYREMINEMEL